MIQRGKTTLARVYYISDRYMWTMMDHDPLHLPKLSCYFKHFMRINEAFHINGCENSPHTSYTVAYNVVFYHVVFHMVLYTIQLMLAPSYMYCTPLSAVYIQDRGSEASISGVILFLVHSLQGRDTLNPDTR